MSQFLLYKMSALTFVALLWGATNPLIRRGTKDINQVKAESRIMQFLLEFKYLVTNLGYLVPMGLNQLGSIIYFVTLQYVDISLAVPVANALTFVFTAMMGWYLNESLPGKRTNIGVCLVLLGTSFLCYDKYLQQEDS